MTVGVIRSGNSASLGTGTTKTSIGNIYFPNDARALLSVKPVMANITPTAAQYCAARLDVESSDIRNMLPFEVLFAPIGSGLGVTYNTLTGMDTWGIGAPLTGGESITAHGTSLANNTVAPEAAAYYVVSNNPQDLNFPQRHAKLGTVTAAGALATGTDADKAGTKYSFSGGRRIVELFGSFLPKTIAAGDALVGGIKFTSSEFVDNYPFELPLYPWSFGLGSTGSILIPGVSRQKVDIPLKPGQVNVQDYLNCGLLAATAGDFIDGVVYE